MYIRKKSSIFFASLIKVAYLFLRRKNERVFLIYKCLLIQNDSWSMEFLVFLPKIGLYYVAIMCRMEKTSTLQNSSTSIIFYQMQPSPSNQQHARKTCFEHQYLAGIYMNSRQI